MTAAVDAAVVFKEEINMDYRKLGPSGTVVTAYCLGTMTFGA
ncbi:aldo/keto reductase, partial [Rhizobium johnstonii]